MAASDTRKPQNQLIYDLIEESNPGFKAAYPLGSLIFTSVTAIAVDSADPQKKDTQVLCRGANGSGVIGNVKVTYRRIDVGTLFKNVLPRLTGYATAGYVRANWIAELNSKFGISVLDSDFDVGWQTMTSGSTYNIPILSTSLCYKGTFSNIGWVSGKRPIGTMITDANRALAGRLYPGGNDFTTPGRKPQGEFQTYGVDASAIKTSLETVPTTWAAPVGQSSTETQQILAWLNANTGRNNWSNQDSSVDGGIFGLTWYRYTVLPNSQVPEANSDRFNHVIVIIANANSWFAGKILIHYNA